MRISLISLCVAFALTAGGAEIKINFNGFPEGSTPTNFFSALAGGGKPGEWKMVMDEVPSAFAPLTPQASSLNRKAVLAQTGADPTDERYPMFIYGGETFRDFKFTTRFKIAGGIAEQMAGVVFSFQNASNFYVIRVSALGKNIAFYKMVNGEIVSPIKLSLEIPTHTWHELEVDRSGSYINCSLDGQKVLPTITDNSPPDGRIGFWTKSDARSYFCDAVVDYTPRITAAQELVNSTMREEPGILGLQIYTLDGGGQPRILASKDEKEIGQPGGDTEKTAIASGKIFFGREKGVVLLTMPLRDRNGEPMAAVHLRLKSFFGEMQNVAITRATTIIKLMETDVTSTDELMK